MEMAPDTGVGNVLITVMHFMKAAWSHLQLTCVLLLIPQVVRGQKKGWTEQLREVTCGKP